MNLDLIIEIDDKLKGIFNDVQRKECLDSIKEVIDKYEIRKIEAYSPSSNEEALTSFIAAKRIEGCSEKTLAYYETTIKKLINEICKMYYLISTEELRQYLSKLETEGCSMVTIDNVRRIISSFYMWLENENYISKSPVKRIHKIKTQKKVKDLYTEEQIELFRQNSGCIRNLAIIDLLYSTGIRVGELVNLKRADIDFQKRECIVTGKGNKQRKVYFDAKTKIHIEQYLSIRKDDSEHLFVSRLSPYNKLQISGVEILLRKIGDNCGIKKVHPHKFRRTLATKAIDKGMPIEQVQHLLGHAKIDTTLEYAMVDDENVKTSHKKFLE